MRRFVFLAVVALSVSPLVARQHTVDAPRALTTADYARAEKFMAANATPLVYHSSVRPTWLADDERFWYRVTTDEGTEAVLVDPAAGTHVRCTLPECARRRRRARTRRGWDRTRRLRPLTSQSPDGTRTAFIRDWNLWVRDVATGTETQLTTDGVKDFGYATDNAGWTQQRPPDRASGRPTRRRSRPSSRTSATSARCTSSTRSVGHPDAAGVEVSAARRRASSR